MRFDMMSDMKCALTAPLLTTLLQYRILVDGIIKEATSLGKDCKDEEDSIAVGALLAILDLPVVKQMKSNLLVLNTTEKTLWKYLSWQNLL